MNSENRTSTVTELAATTPSQCNPEVAEVSYFTDICNSNNGSRRPIMQSSSMEGRAFYPEHDVAMNVVTELLTQFGDNNIQTTLEEIPEHECECQSTVYFTIKVTQNAQRNVPRKVFIARDWISEANPEVLLLFENEFFALEIKVNRRGFLIHKIFKRTTDIKVEFSFCKI